MNAKYIYWFVGIVCALTLHAILFVSIHIPAKQVSQEIGVNGINTSIISLKKIKQGDTKILKDISKIKKPKTVAKHIPKVVIKPITKKQIQKKLIATREIPQQEKKVVKRSSETQRNTENNIALNKDTNKQQKSSSIRNDMTGTNAHSGNNKATSLGGSSNKAKSNYMASLKKILETKKRYPERAKKRRQEGTVQLWFKISSNGKLISYKIKEGSGHRLLDKEVEDLINRVSPFPQFPKDMRVANIEVTVPMSFKIK